jgi:hypothetical protein
MSEEPAAPGTRTIAPELWAGIVIVVVCLGAYVGPKLYVHFHRERIVGRLAEPLSSPRFGDERDFEKVAVELMAEEAKALGVDAGGEWTAVLIPAEAAELVGFDLTPGAPADYANGVDLRCARFLLQRAGAMPREEPGAEGRR